MFRKAFPLDNLEVEARYLVKDPKGVLRKLEDLYGHPEIYLMEDTYFDTPEMKLLRHYKASLRLRKKEDELLITFKRKIERKGDVFVRKEIEHRIPKRFYDRIVGLGKFRFQFEDIDEELHRVVHVSSRRWVFAKGITLDEVHVKDTRVYFLEVEGSLETIDEFRRKHLSDLEVHPTELSKLEWALKLSGKLC